MTAPDQPTGMNELRAITDKFLADCELTSRDYIREEIPAERAKVEIQAAQEEAEAAVQQLVERCLLDKLPEWHTAIGGQDVQNKDAHNVNVTVDRIRHNLQQAGLLKAVEEQNGIQQ